VENKWHAQRYGIAATFVDPFSRSPLTVKQWLDQVFDFIAEDIEALGCAGEIRRLHRILAEGTSADRQIEMFGKAKASGRRRLAAIKDVVDWAARETQAFGGKRP
jgi:carboxylate-amine ligase